jgi:cardiolipin synthase
VPLHARPARPGRRSATRPSRLKGTIRRRWRRRLEPPVTKARRPRGVRSIWVTARRIIWAPRFWFLFFVIALVWDEWVWAIVMGLLAFMTYVAAPAERAPVFGLDHDMGIESDEFLNSLIGLTGAPFLAGNTLTILNNGDEFYPSMLEAIAKAKHSITIEAYIYWDGEIGLNFAKALAGRARAGVEVKILLDAVGSSTIGQRILSELEGGGCQVAWFNPPRFLSLDWLNHRTHRKSLVIDGRIGFTGGAGIADIWLGNAQDEHHWRDLHVRIEGPGAVPLQTGFSENWQVTTGEFVNGAAFFPEPRAAGKVPIQTIMSVPTSGASDARTLYYLSIVCARRSIHIANPYFVPDPMALDLLADATRRGVRVKVIVAGTHNDAWLARQNSVQLYGALLDAGIEVYEYNRTMLHQKTMIVDGAWATIGTTNFDDRSFTLNDETNLSFFDPALVYEMDRIFAADLAVSERVTKEQWETRGVAQRAREGVAWLFRDQV